MTALRILAKQRGLRGTPFEIFGHTPEQKMERRLIADYEATLQTLLAGLNRDNHAITREIAAPPRRPPPRSSLVQPHQRLATSSNGRRKRGPILSEAGFL
jgi:hypothetical protein